MGRNNKKAKNEAVSDKLNLSVTDIPQAEQHSETEHPDDTPVAEDTEIKESYEYEDDAESDGEETLTEEQLRRAKKKKRLITALSVIGGITVVILILHYFGIIDLTKPWTKEKEVSYEVELWRLYPPDWDTDIFTIKEYTDKPDWIYYKTMGAQSVGLVDKDYSSCSDGVLLLVDYIDALKHGNHKKVNSMHTAEWLEEHGSYEEFTMQKIYDVTVEHLREYTVKESDGSYVTKYDYCLTYRIMKNDGTFRKDVYPDGIRPLYFEITEKNGVMKISRTEYTYWNLPQ